MNIKVGDPFAEATSMGPLANKAQFEKVQRMINMGIEEGAKLIAGGPGRPEGIQNGYFVKPTVFADVRNDMTIAREEVFGPVTFHHPLRGRGRRYSYCERHRLRVVQLRDIGRHGPRTPSCAADSIGQRAYQWRSARLQRLFWRL